MKETISKFDVAFFWLMTSTVVYVKIIHGIVGNQAVSWGSIFTYSWLFAAISLVAFHFIRAVVRNTGFEMIMESALGLALAMLLSAAQFAIGLLMGVNLVDLVFWGFPFVLVLVSSLILWKILDRE